MKNDRLQQLAGLPPFSLQQDQKADMLRASLQDLTGHHYESCELYRNIVDNVFGGTRALQFERIEDSPFLPVSFFKNHELFSVPREQIIRVLTSSGTSGQVPSRIYLDRATADVQTRVLIKIMQHFLGKQRLPLILIDQEKVMRDRATYSARSAGILGISQCGRNPWYALTDDLALDVEGLLAYLEAVPDRRVLLFGFTFMVWQYFILELERRNITLDLPEAILVHGGGWKKLQSLNVTRTEFRDRVQKVTAISQCLNFYGMVEQVGSIYMENSLGYLHAPNYSDILIRDPRTLKPLAIGEPGVIQLVSLLPFSYPGHSILTEDLGVIRGTDAEGLGMGGRYFEVLGRVPKAQVRGCSDTFQR